MSYSWPDWSGQTAVIVATGPSADKVCLEAVKDKAKFIVIKRSWMLAPWADMLYGIDKGWWIANYGAMKFKGMKACPSPTICRAYPDIRLVKLKARAEILVEKTGVLGCGLQAGGGYSGFQAINLAIQFGAKRIVLVGFDMTLGNGAAHWHQDYRGVGKPDVRRVKSWREAMDGCASQFERLGVAVVNTSEPSALMAYPKMGLMEAVNGDQHAR